MPCRACWARSCPTASPNSLKRSAALALALLEGGERPTPDELRAAARRRDEPLAAAEARAVQARVERVFQERFGGPGGVPDQPLEARSFALVTRYGEVVAVTFSQGDALRAGRVTGHRVVPVLVREAPVPTASSGDGAAAVVRRDLARATAAALGAVAPGGAVELPLPKGPVERRTRQGQIAGMAGRLWGKDRVRVETPGNALVLTRLDAPRASRARRTAADAGAAPAPAPA